MSSSNDIQTNPGETLTPPKTEPPVAQPTPATTTTITNDNNNNTNTATITTTTNNKNNDGNNKEVDNHNNVEGTSITNNNSAPMTTNEYNEWGNPNERQNYDYLLSYSPYDNVRAQAYPAMLITTGLWDSQVQYYEPAKWIAKLRALKTDHNSVFLRVDMEAGHGGKAGRFQRFREIAMEYVFLLREAGIHE